MLVIESVGGGKTSELFFLRNRKRDRRGQNEKNDRTFRLETEGSLDTRTPLNATEDRVCPLGFFRKKQSALAFERPMKFTDTWRTGYHRTD